MRLWFGAAGAERQCTPRGTCPAWSAGPSISPLAATPGFVARRALTLLV